MLKYVLAATALRAFSVNSTTRRAYRKLGNFAGGRKRGRAVRPHYFERAEGNLAWIERHNAIADGMKLVELGTGWVHWESLYTRLFYDVRITLFDVWDNRQFEGFLHHACELRRSLRLHAGARAEDKLAKAESLLDRLALCSGFEEAYDLLGFTYLVNDKGSLSAIADGSIDLVISSDVMEHVPRDSMARLIGDFRRILRPGGCASQQIVETDHLTIYDRSIHAKNYLRYTDRQWQRWFDNHVQHINRLQHSDFVKAFADGGFEIAGEEVVASCDSTRIPIAPQFAHYDRADLDATVTRLIARKPSAS